MTSYQPETAILSLGPDFFDPVEAAQFPQAILRFRNDRAAAQVGLADLSDAQWTDHFGRFTPLPGSLTQPLALRYHGHQFRNYNPDLGDGRGFLFAQLRDEAGRLMDLGTKGSGTTPWSRAGDGRLTLKGAVREILATEMLEALGVHTSRTFSVIETGEKLVRSDEPSPTRGAVLVRLNHSHVRYGSFQRQAYLQNHDGLHRLVDYALTHFAPAASGPTPVAALIDYAVQGAARLAAQFMAAGFVHGVLNTDNINITGESFDYGPWRFAPAWDASFTAAYFDHSGLYAFGRQAEALQWNLYQLGNALRLIAEVDEVKAPLETYPQRYRSALCDAVLGRLGVRRLDPDADGALVDAVQAALVATQMDPDRFFFDWRSGMRRGASPAEHHYSHDAFADLIRLLPARTNTPPAHAYWADDAPCTMLIDEVETIWAAIAERDDWSVLNDKIAAIRRMGEAHAQA
ncbi:protein adenylyltransferase SelO family protein [Sandarakinorhabdus sp.]|uniref:protein adenylyltransferase SelO family protein n=1 Tax=Sandarakinorhabdus sp. TaxID=1916663 RepID=UPI00333E3407